MERGDTLLFPFFIIRQLTNQQNKKKMSEKQVEFKEGETATVKGAPESTGAIEPAVPESIKKVAKEAVKATSSKKRDPEAFKAMFSKAGKISVKPYVDPNKENMGLEDYGMAIFPGTHQEEQLAAIERNGVIRYITGLDEYAPEVQNIIDKEQKAAVIFNIRSIVAHLEKTLATNVIKVDDEDFWSKVQLCRPDNHDFWGKISLRIGNEPTFLKPAEDPYDLIKFVSIEAGGFDLVGKSFEDAMAQAVAPRFFLDKEVHTVSTRTTYKRLRNKAIGLLDKIANKNVKKLLYITKVIDTNSSSYKAHTPPDIMYDVCDDYVNGLGIEPNKSKAAEHFIEIAGLDMETLKLKALVKDATFYKVISLKVDGMLYHTATQTMLGRNVSDVVLYLKNPLNEDVLIKLLDEIETYWNT